MRNQQHEAEKSPRKIKLPRIGTQSIKEANDYQNDFFNLYNDSICSDSYNVSGSSSSDDEIRVVSNGQPGNKQTKKYASLDSDAEDSYSNFEGLDLDVLERIVVGCEDSETRGIGRKPKIGCRRRDMTKPKACSTMLKSPNENKEQQKLTLSRKDSGISEGMQSDNSSSGSLQEHMLNQTFVVSSSDRILFCDETTPNKQEVTKNDVGMLSAIKKCSEDIRGVDHVDEDAYVETPFYNKRHGVPRTSTKAKLRLTPRKSCKITSKNTGKQTTRTRVKPFTKLLRLFARKDKENNNEGNKVGNRHGYNIDLEIPKGGKQRVMTDLEKLEMIRKMRYFQESWSNYSADIRTLANL